MFWCPYPLCDRRVVVGGEQLGQPQLGSGLVRVMCLGLLLQSLGLTLFISLLVVHVVPELHLFLQKDNGLL